MGVLPSLEKKQVNPYGNGEYEDQGSGTRAMRLSQQNLKKLNPNPNDYLTRSKEVNGSSMSKQDKEDLLSNYYKNK